MKSLSRKTFWQHTLSAAILTSSLLSIGGFASAADMTAIPPVDSTDLPTVVPGKHEIAESAFAKLDKGQKGFISEEDVQVLPNFDRLFQRVDADHDGKLTRKEFKVAWYVYTANADAKTRVN